MIQYLRKGQGNKVRIIIKMIKNQIKVQIMIIWKIWLGYSLLNQLNNKIKNLQGQLKYNKLKIKNKRIKLYKILYKKAWQIC